MAVTDIDIVEFPSWSLKFDAEGLDNEMFNLHRDVVFGFIKENLEELNRRFWEADAKAHPDRDAHARP